jgi:hypothetical protein
MRPSGRYLCAQGAAWAAGLAAAPGIVPAQTLSNPDISVIADTRLVARSSEFAARAGTRDVQFEFEEAELNFAGYLNPTMRADVTIGAHDFEGPFEIEEVSMTVLRGLPLSLQLKVGKYFLDFGKINTQHAHQWPWLERPLMMRAMLGEEGLLPLGAQLTTLQALGENAITLSVNAFRSDAFAAEHEVEGQGGGTEGAPETLLSGRLAWSRTLGVTTAEAGLSGLGGRFDPAEGLDVTLAGFDFKLRWRPDTYRAVDIVAEAMWSDREVARGDSAAAPTVSAVRAAGAFAAARVQFRKRWDAGAFFDFTEDAVVEDARTTAGGAWFAFMPVEETARFNLVYRYESSDLYAGDDQSLSLQFLFGLGPHRPHRF